MTPYTFALPTHTRGDTISAITINDIQEDEVAIDLTGVGIRMQIRDAKGVLLYDYSIGSGITLLSSNSVQIDDFIINEVGNFVADIEFTFPSGEIRTWFKINIFILDDVTK